MVVDKPQTPSENARLPDFHSVEGRAIPVHTFGSDGRTIMLMAGVHGDETSGVAMVASILRRLEAQFASSKSAPNTNHPSADRRARRVERQAPNTVTECRMVIMPLCNPDGYEAGTRRNARKIDINRNFPTKDFVGEADHPGGVEAASEPETRAILEVVEHFDPYLIITLHEAMACVNYNGTTAEAVADRISACCGLPTMGDIGYPCPGSMGTYYGWERELPVITLELPKPDVDMSLIEQAVLKELGI